MSILLTSTTRAIVQGGTGRIGSKQTEWMIKAGTPLVAGVTPGKGGSTLHGLPVFDTVKGAVRETKTNASVLFVPAPHVRRAALEAIRAGIRLLVVIAEHVPVHDSLEVREACREAGAVMIGPNTPGVISPGIGKLGIMPANLFSTGSVGMISRSGTLSYEVAGILQKAGIGISTMVGIGGDPVVGTDMAELLPMFVSDLDTEAIVVVGEIGGNQEERLAEALHGTDFPVCAYVAGRAAPSGKRMGHAGALIRGHQGSTEGKEKALQRAGARVTRLPSDLPGLLQRMVSSTSSLS